MSVSFTICVPVSHQLLSFTKASELKVGYTVIESTECDELVFSLIFVQSKLTLYLTYFITENISFNIRAKGNEKKVFAPFRIWNANLAIMLLHYFYFLLFILKTWIFL